MKITARKRMLEVAGRRLERKNVRKEEWYNNVEAGAGGNTALARVLVPVEKKGEGRSSVDRESNNQQLIRLEEKDVVTSVATVLSDLCGLREWMAMEKLHTEGEKDWTRRIGNDRYLICMEDLFVVSHDLGRVVDKFIIKFLREEFERAIDVMQYDPNPWITLFEPYVPG